MRSSRAVMVGTAPRSGLHWGLAQPGYCALRSAQDILPSWVSPRWVQRRPVLGWVSALLGLMDVPARTRTVGLRKLRVRVRRVWASGFLSGVLRSDRGRR